jgi:hypothetical protein
MSFRSHLRFMLTNGQVVIIFALVVVILISGCLNGPQPICTMMSFWIRIRDSSSVSIAAAAVIFDILDPLHESRVSWPCELGAVARSLSFRHRLP